MTLYNAFLKAVRLEDVLRLTGRLFQMLGTVHLIFWGGGPGIFWKKNSLL